MMDNRIIMTYLQKVVLGTLWCVRSLHVVVDCDLPQLGRDSASSGTCCRMQLRAATKPTDAKLCSSHQEKGSINQGFCGAAPWRIRASWQRCLVL